MEGVDEFVPMADIKARIAHATERANAVDTDVRTSSVTVTAFVNI